LNRNDGFTNRHHILASVGAAWSGYRTDRAPRASVRERLADPQPRAPEHDDQATHALSVDALPDDAHDGDDRRHRAGTWHEPSFGQVFAAEDARSVALRAIAASPKRKRT